jgi:hypothetical protein
MASTINTSTVKLRTSSNGCLPFKSNDHENKPYVGISRIRRYRIVLMCKGKRKYDYEAPMTSSLSDCTWLKKESKFHLSTMWHPFLHFIFLSLDSSLSYLSYHSSFFLFLFQSLSFIFSYTYFFFTFLFFFLSFPYTYFSFYFSLSWHLYLSSERSQLLSFLHKHNLNFKIKPC